MASPYLNMDDRKISDEAIVKNVAIWILVELSFIAKRAVNGSDANKEIIIA